MKKGKDKRSYSQQRIMIPSQKGAKGGQDLGGQAVYLFLP